MSKQFECQVYNLWKHCCVVQYLNILAANTLILNKLAHNFRILSTRCALYFYNSQTNLIKSRATCIDCWPLINCVQTLSKLPTNCQQIANKFTIKYLRLQPYHTNRTESLHICGAEKCVYHSQFSLFFKILTHSLNALFFY